MKDKIIYSSLQIENVAIENLVAPYYYCRADIEGKKEFLRKSIELYGLITPLVVNSHPDRMNVIIDGVARWQICKELNHKSIKVIQLNSTKEQEIQQHIICNQQARKFYEEFVKNELNPELALILIKHFASTEEVIVSENNSNSTGADLDNEITKFSVALYRREADWCDKMKKARGYRNRSAVIQFLIKSYTDNGNNKAI